jgi:hypothetical protein
LEQGDATPAPQAKAAPEPERDTADRPVVLSKNKRDQINKEVAELENKISGVEAEIASLELYFQAPTPGTDWESTHRRYLELKGTLDALYNELATRWEIIG